MYIIRGNFFGFFIASSYSSPNFVALLLVQVPTLSFLAVAVLFVWYTYFLADPLGPPTLPLLVVLAFSCSTFFGDAWDRP